MADRNTTQGGADEVLATPYTDKYNNKITPSRKIQGLVTTWNLLFDQNYELQSHSVVMGSIVELPKGDSPTLQLVHPTEKEKMMQFNMNGKSWRRALSIPAYLRREATLSQQAFTRDGGITYWILVDTVLDGNPLNPASGTRLPLASCETYRMKALVWQDGELHESICHVIGSVFCGEHLRGNGYAQRMMRELSKVLRTHQMEGGTENQFSVLFSDIGKKFYNKFGWEPFNSSHIAIPCTSSVANHGLPTARPLFAEDLEELCEIDMAAIRQSLKARPKGSRLAVALLPTAEKFQWYHAREEFVGTELFGKMPKIKGAMVGTELGKRVWCFWTHMWYNSNRAEAEGNTLYILRLVVEDGSLADVAASNQDLEASIAALLAMAQQAGEEWNMEHVEMWNPAAVTVKAAQRLWPSAKVVHRDVESIASLQWFPEHHGPMAPKMDWIANEKYGWC
ncbi:hypothetical protein ACEQ8H_001799 [Pleosporales sp. CAS-2024a]